MFYYFFSFSYQLFYFLTALYAYSSKIGFNVCLSFEPSYQKFCSKQKKITKFYKFLQSTFENLKATL